VRKVVNPYPGEGEITLLDVKPAVGFTLPWAGVTPAPSIKKSRNVEDDISLSSSVLVSF
jgi:hypothetical protein